jgi:hypothetical protein
VSEALRKELVMPTDPRKRQKQQERRAAKRKSKQHELARQKQAGLAERMAGAARFPILHCWITKDVWTQGLGYVGLSRQLPNGTVAFALFLVDRYCLGVKNVMAEIMGRFTYDSRLREMHGDFTWDSMDPAAARKFIEGAVAYARDLGLQPHADYQKAKPIFGDLDAGQSSQQFEYGKDGKPFFMAGPHDTPERCRHILKTLEEKCGPDGFHFMIPASSDMAVVPESLQHRETRLIGTDESGGR